MKVVMGWAWIIALEHDCHCVLDLVALVSAAHYGSGFGHGCPRNCMRSNMVESVTDMHECPSFYQSNPVICVA